MAPLGPVAFVTIHCTATPEGRPNTAAEISAWDIQRFGQVSYHWVVELDGSKHNTLSDTLLGAHTGKHNRGNIGISYVGGTETLNAGGKPKDTRTPAQREAIRELVAHYKALHPSVTVRGHRDWPGVAKACPSFSVATQL